MVARFSRWAPPQGHLRLVLQAVHSHHQLLHRVLVHVPVQVVLNHLQVPHRVLVHSPVQVEECLFLHLKDRLVLHPLKLVQYLQEVSKLQAINHRVRMTQPPQIKAAEDPMNLCRVPIVLQEPREPLLRWDLDNLLPQYLMNLRWFW